MNTYTIRFSVRSPYTYPASVEIDANSEKEAMRMFEEACQKANNEVCRLPLEVDVCFDHLNMDYEVALDCDIEVSNA